MTRRYGTGSIYTRKSDGRVVGAVRVAGERVVVYGETKTAVQHELDAIRADARRGVVHHDRRLTVGTHLQQWLEAVRPTVRPSTWESYEGHVRLHLALLARTPLSSLTPNDVRRLIRERLAAACAPRTVAYTVTVLRMALRQAERDGLVPRNVAAIVDAPRAARTEVIPPSSTGVRRLIAAETPYCAIWTLLAGAGLRLGEALGLRWNDVDLDAGTLTVRVALRAAPRHTRPEAAKWSRTGQRLGLVEPKTAASRRTVALPTFVTLALRAHRDAQASVPASILGLVFTSPKGTPLDPRNVSRAFDHDRSLVGMEPLRIHDLRHFAASQMLAGGCSLDDVKRYLGHASIAHTSDIYGHLVEGRSRQVADAMERVLG